jgi:hypothetical protein
VAQPWCLDVRHVGVHGHVIPGSCTARPIVSADSALSTGGFAGVESVSLPPCERLGNGSRDPEVRQARAVSERSASCRYGYPEHDHSAADEGGPL